MLQDIDGAALELVIDYVYTADITVTEDNVQVRRTLRLLRWELGRIFGASTQGAVEQWQDEAGSGRMKQAVAGRSLLLQLTLPFLPPAADTSLPPATDAPFPPSCS